MGDNLTKSIKQYAATIPTVDAIVEMKRIRGKRAVIRRCLSYEELDLRIDQYVAKFLQKGVRKGARVLMLLSPSVEMVCTFFALIRMGAIPILIDSGMGFRAFIRLANFSKPDFIVCLRWVGWLISCNIFNIQGKVIVVQRPFAKNQMASNILQNTDPEDRVAIFFTSGSTGMAKGVVYKYRNFAAQLNKLRLTYKLLPYARDVTLLPVFMFFNPMFGRTLIIPDMDFSHPSKLHLPSIIETIVNNCATSSFASPMLWDKISEYCSKYEIKIRSLEQIFLAGVSATTHVLEKIRNVAPNAKIFTPYGATECLPVCSVSADEILDEIQPLQENGAGTCIGIPIDGIEVKIIQPEDGIVSTIDDKNSLSLGYIGEIVVTGDNVTELYDQLPEQTILSKIYHEGKVWHRTGDLGFFDQKGRIWFCGRKIERVVARNGETYYPDCIEPLFHKHPSVERAALIPLIRRGTVLPAIAILPKKGQYPFFFWQKWLFRRELKNLAQKFPKTAPITHFFFCRKFPVDPRHNAKIHRLKLGKKFS
ncbi:MAG: AMP-binding protein [Puniceicoccales bacterium]|jgi:acyl-CoA synthetase (AMP-forming)/AMP-acid ligase II|nr:AMP-binding protein [Puniceicoccales bacterium]